MVRRDNDSSCMCPPRARPGAVRSGLCHVCSRPGERCLNRGRHDAREVALEPQRHGRVAVVLGREDGVVRIRIRDSGAGIPLADRARIFDRFVQLDPSRRARGAGLGLPIARWIAEAHGGTLILESSGPNGSTFCVTLPIRT